MSNYTRTSSRTNAWVSPRAHTDAGLRLHHYGPIEPLADDRDHPRFSWVRAVVIALGFWGALFLFALVTP